MIDHTTLIQRNPAIVFSQLDEEYLALDAEAGFCYSLNPVSGRIWRLIEQPTTFIGLCAQLQQEYTVDETTCRRDVDEVLTGLAKAGLVTLNDAPIVA
jgi:hypothetical protein